MPSMTANRRAASTASATTIPTWSKVRSPGEMAIRPPSAAEDGTWRDMGLAGRPLGAADGRGLDGDELRAARLQQPLAAGGARGERRVAELLGEVDRTGCQAARPPVVHVPEVLEYRRPGGVLAGFLQPLHEQQAER